MTLLSQVILVVAFVGFVGFLLLSVVVFIRERFFTPAVVAIVLLIATIVIAGPTVREILYLWMEVPA